MTTEARSVTMDTRLARLQIPDTEFMARVKDAYVGVTKRTALPPLIRTYELYREYRSNNGGKNPPEDVTKKWKDVEIDKAAADAMEDALQNIPFRTRSVGSEGGKEIHHAGIAAPSVQGVYGANRMPEMWKISDVVEGTTALSRLSPGSVSALAVTRAEGVMPVPKDAHYMMKLIGPTELNRDPRISIERPHKENLELILKALEIKPHQLIQVTMVPTERRIINKQYVDAAQELGVNVHLIEAGDLLPGVLSASGKNSEGKYTILVGRGGREEGGITAVAAKALGGFMQGREYDVETNTPTDFLTLEDLVPGKRDELLVSLSGITGDPTWFNVPGVIHLRDGRHFIETLVIDGTGIHRIKQMFNYDLTPGSVGKKSMTPVASKVV